MKYVGITILTAAICFGARASEPKHINKDCWKNAVSQLDLNGCAGSETETTDAELNRVYKAIKDRNKKDAIFLKSLKKSQLAWIKYRDAQVEMKFPPYGSSTDTSYYYGSMQPMCEATYETQLTRERISVLKEWLVRHGDDGCSGSQP